MTANTTPKPVFRNPEIPMDLDEQLRPLVPDDINSVGLVSRRVIYVLRDWINIQISGVGGSLPSHSPNSSAAGVLNPIAPPENAPGDASADPGADGEGE
jgi:hypothetical protein